MNVTANSVLLRLQHDVGMAALRWNAERQEQHTCGPQRYERCGGEPNGLKIETDGERDSRHRPGDEKMRHELMRRSGEERPRDIVHAHPLARR